MLFRYVGIVLFFLALVATPSAALAQKMVTGLTLTPDRSAPQPAGTTIRWTARASGGVKPYSYRWWVYDGTWRMVKDWTSSASYSWTPASASNGYKVGVWVRSAWNTSDVDERNLSVPFRILPAITSLALTPDPSAPQRAGSSIRWTAASTGGVPPHSYKWSLFNGSTWSTLQDWTTSTTYTWSPMVPNANYLVRVAVRSDGMSGDVPERDATASYAIKPGVTDLTLTPDKPAPQPAGASIQWTATASGGVAPYSYRWWIYNSSGWNLAQDWTTGGTFIWTPSTANGSYKVGVWARSADNLTDVDERNLSVPFPIYPAVTNLTLTPSVAAPQRAGTSVRWTASATGGTPPYSFKWWVFDGVDWRVLQEWSTSDNYVWTPVIPNPNYIVRVWARSAGVASDAPERTVSVGYAITPGVTELTLTPDQPSPQHPGTVIRWTAAAGGGIPPYKYKWWLYNDRSGWRILQDWTSSATYTWTPVVADRSYKIGVWARSADNATDVDERNLSVAFPIQLGVTRLTLTPDQPPPKPVGATITWTAAADGGLPPYKYKWWLYGRSGWTLLQDWTLSSTYTWRPTSYYNGYRIGVWAKSADNETDVDESNLSVPFPVQLSPEDRERCTYSVAPLTITVGPENGSGEVHVATSDGCPWTAAITNGGIVESLEPTDETGSATIGYSIANNTGSEPRYGTLTVATKTVALTQAGRFPDPVCNYSLSTSLDTVPIEGGSGFVDVITTAGCSWSAFSSTGWVRIVGGTSGTGPGRVTYSVDANPGDGRSTTLLVASRGLDLLQVGRDPVTEVPVLLWDDVPVSVAEDSIVSRPFQVYIWESYPNRHAPELGECFGNCGAGCSSRFNPCGGRTQWWELKILTEPEHIEGSRWQDVLCYDDFFYLYDFERYRAMGRWIYHGHAGVGCLVHDANCPEATWLGCLAFGGCGTEWDKDWSYDDLVIASKVADIQEIGPGTCP